MLDGHNHQPFTETRLYPPGETDGERGEVDRWRKGVRESHLEEVALVGRPEWREKKTPFLGEGRNDRGPRLQAGCWLPALP